MIPTPRQLLDTEYTSSEIDQLIRDMLQAREKAPPEDQAELTAMIDDMLATKARLERLRGRRPS